jgi:N-acetylglucosamine-6-phosphate deacetylase
MAAYALHAQHFILPSKMTGEGYLVVEDGKFGRFFEEKPDRRYRRARRCDRLSGPCRHPYPWLLRPCNDRLRCRRPERRIARACPPRHHAWLPTTFTDSVDNIAKQCEAIHDARASRDDGFMGARMPGIYLEGPFFTYKHKGAQNPKYLVPPSYAAYRRWQESSDNMIVKSALAAEYDEAEEYISKLAAEGVVTAIGHSDATYAETLSRRPCRCYLLRPHL